MNRKFSSGDARKIPVLVVSNSASPDKVHRMLALGAKKYMLKAESRLDDLVKIVDETIMEPEGGNGA